MVSFLALLPRSLTTFLYAVAALHVSWTNFTALLEGLGEKRHTRLAYYQGLLEIMSVGSLLFFSVQGFCENTICSV